MFFEYDRISAMEYARRWALSRNPRFKDYENWGGNCTNYISQCINAGKIPMDNRGNNIMKQWYWYEDNKRTPSWTSSQLFFEYCINNNKEDTENFGIYAVETSYDKLELGDIVQLVENNKAYHTMIITNILLNNNEIYVKTLMIY